MGKFSAFTLSKVDFFATEQQLISKILESDKHNRHCLLCASLSLHSPWPNQCVFLPIVPAVGNADKVVFLNNFERGDV